MVTRITDVFLCFFSPVKDGSQTNQYDRGKPQPVNSHGLRGDETFLVCPICVDFLVCFAAIWEKNKKGRVAEGLAWLGVNNATLPVDIDFALNGRQDIKKQDGNQHGRVDFSSSILSCISLI